MAFTEKLRSGRHRGGYWGTVDGKRKKIWVPGTHGRKSDAKAAADEEAVKAKRQAAPRTGSALPASTTWGEWWDILVADREFESDTAVVEKSIVEAHLRPEWGDTALNEIDNLAIQDWIDRLVKRRSLRGTRYSPTYIRRIYGVFTASINVAIRRKILWVSPLAGITLPKVPKRMKKSAMSLTEAQQYGVKLRAPRKRGALDVYADVIDFGMETGLRPGELAGFHDDQVDKKRRVLTVRTVYVRRKKMMRGYPKDEDERDIPLTAKAWAIYKRHTGGRDMQRSCGVEHVDGPCSSDIVFRTWMGRVLNSDALRVAMKAAADDAGIERRSPYAVRRGFATRLRTAGADVATIMELMGHEKFDESHGYMQQPADFDLRVRAALDDPEVAGLHVVGQDAERGTAHGTDLVSEPLPDAHKGSGRRSS